MPLRKWSLLHENYIQFGWGENRGLNSSFPNKGFLKWQKFSSSRLSGWADIRAKRKSYSHYTLLMESLVLCLSAIWHLIQHGTFQVLFQFLSSGRGQKCLFIYALPHLKPMVTHFSGKSARSLPQNPMQRPTALTVSQPDSGSFPFGSVFYVIHDWQEPLSRFSSVISFFCLLCSPSIFLQLFHHLCLCPSLSPFSSQFSLQHAISPFPHAFCFCPVLQLFSPFSSAPLFASHFSALLLAEDY